MAVCERSGRPHRGLGSGAIIRGFFFSKKAPERIIDKETFRTKYISRKTLNFDIDKNNLMDIISTTVGKTIHRLSSTKLVE